MKRILCIIEFKMRRKEALEIKIKDKISGQKRGSNVDKKENKEL